VKVQAPPNSHSKFFNYKHSFSVVLLALVEARYKLTVAGTGLCRRNSDGEIFAYSRLGKYLETHLGLLEDKQLPRTTCLAPHVIVGDGGFSSENVLNETLPRIAKQRGQ
jgi:hypothetical protein